MLTFILNYTKKINDFNILNWKKKVFCVFFHRSPSQYARRDFRPFPELREEQRGQDRQAASGIPQMDPARSDDPLLRRLIAVRRRTHLLRQPRRQRQSRRQTPATRRRLHCGRYSSRRASAARFGRAGKEGGNDFRIKTTCGPDLTSWRS